MIRTELANTKGQSICIDLKWQITASTKLDAFSSHLEKKPTEPQVREILDVLFKDKYSSRS